jgi:cytochrome c-type protein NapC
VIKKLWNWFWSPTAKFGWGLIFIVGGIAGITFWGGFNTYMEHTNTLQFCVSCHEMRDNVYPEYQRSAHYTNPSGVRLVCSDCHVPKDWTAKLIRKIKATNELYHAFVGTIDTPELFEANRLAMAEHVWSQMEANDSRECRNCHSFEAMDLDEQDRRPRQKHAEAMEEGKTCIDCHKGIAHNLPEGYDDDD